MSSRGCSVRYLLLLALGAAAPTVMHAQGSISRGLGIAGTGGYYSLGGSNYEGIDPGPGAEATLRITTPPELQFLIGGHYSTHDYSESSEKWRFAEVFLEPRLIPDQDANLSPFVGLRISVIRHMFQVDGEDTDNNGWAAGITAGFVLQMGPILAIELGGSAQAILAGDEGGYSLGSGLGVNLTPFSR